MLKSTRNQVIALAGLAQAIHLVQEIAKAGQADPEAMAASIGSALKIDAENVEDVYGGGLEGLREGLLKLRQQLGMQGRIDPEHARYSAHLILLQSRLESNPEALRQVRAGVEQAAGCARKSPLLDETVLEILAETYRRNISPLGPRLLITGDRTQLSSQSNAHKIRALLLAGVRSAVLWRQCGGARWKLLLYRRRLQQTLQSLSAEHHAD